MLRDSVIKFYDKKYDLNCAECIMIAANEVYDLRLEKQTLKAMASFGGGMGIESVCGAATGAIAVIGIVFTNVRGHESTHVKEITIEFMNEFRQALDSLKCDRLKELYRGNDEDRCIKMMLEAADILERLIDKYKELRVS